MIQAKLQVYFWLGSIKHKKNYPSGLPPGFQPTSELQNAERPAIPPPTTIHYSEKHVSLPAQPRIYSLLPAYFTSVNRKVPLLQYNTSMATVALASNGIAIAFVFLCSDCILLGFCQTIYTQCLKITFFKRELKLLALLHL